jgi:hypothetical protein
VDNLADGLALTASILVWMYYDLPLNPKHGPYYVQLKLQYHSFKAVKEKSGTGFNEEECWMTGTDNWWIEQVSVTFVSVLLLLRLTVI